MFQYYACLTLGICMVMMSTAFFIHCVRQKRWQWRAVWQIIGSFAIGSVLLWMTVPQVNDVVSEQLTSVIGTCTIEVDTSSRRANAVFQMIESGERFLLHDILYAEDELYQCELIVTNDGFWVMEYNVYDIATKARLYSSDKQ